MGAQVKSRENLNVIHIGAGRFRPGVRDHVTYGIWRALSEGFRTYHVIGRSSGAPADWTEDNLRVTLIASWSKREAEFLLSQFTVVPLMLRTRPDVIVCQAPALGGLAALLVARLTGARTLMELHGNEYFVPTQPGSRLWALQKLTKFALARTDHIRVLSHGMQKAFVRVYGDGLAERIHVLPPRVDTARFEPSQRQRDMNEPLRIATVGAVNANKGQIRLIQALAGIPFPTELHIAGSGPDLPAVFAQAEMLRQHNSELQVIIHGALPHVMVAKLLRECDVFVMYSISEATPRALMEAMAIGLPVITTDAGFCADIVGHGREGFILGPTPDRDIVPLLQRFRDEPHLVERMGAAARERAVRDYDSVRLFEEYRRLIEETASR